MKLLRYQVIQIVLCAIAVLLSGCEIAGLQFQEDAPYDYHVLDPQMGMSALEYLDQPREDTLFKLMREAVAYAGLEEEYSKPNRTFLFLPNGSILSFNRNGSVNSNCFFGYHRRPDGESGTAWTDYPVDEVKEFLLYHIFEGVYTFGQNLDSENAEVTTLTGEKAYIRAGNERGSPVRINDFPYSLRPTTARTSNLQTTNGVIHVINGFIVPGTLLDHD